MDEYLQTTFHLFTQCEALATTRFEIFGAAFDKPLHELKKTDILKFVRKAGLKVFPSDREEEELRNNSAVLNIEEEEII